MKFNIGWKKAHSTNNYFGFFNVLFLRIEILNIFSITYLIFQLRRPEDDHILQLINVYGLQCFEYKVHYDRTPLHRLSILGNHSFCIIILSLIPTPEYAWTSLFAFRSNTHTKTRKNTHLILAASPVTPILFLLVITQTPALANM